MLMVWVFIFIFLTRFLFLSISPSFYDSVEYLRLFDLSNLADALRQVHPPAHPFFILVYFLFNKIPLSTTFFKAEFLTAIFGTLSSVFFYKIVKKYSVRPVILTLIFSFLPYVWLSQINLLYEPLLILLLLISFFFLVEGQRKDKKIKNYLLSGLSFSCAFLVSGSAIFYLILVTIYLVKEKKFDEAPSSLRSGYLLPLLRRERNPFEAESSSHSSSNLCLRFSAKGDKLFFFSFLAAIFLGLSGYFFLIKERGLSVSEIFTFLSSSNGLFQKIKLEGVMFFVRAIRNSLVVYFNYLTIPVGILLSCLGILSFLRNQGRKLIISWLVCFLLLNSYWHIGMFGRLALFLTIVPLFLLLKIKNKIILGLILLFLIIRSSMLVLPYRFKETPILLERHYLIGLKIYQPLLIVSNYEEPYLKDDFEVLVLNAPSTDIAKIKEKINKGLIENRLIFITSQAIFSPYFQYDGMKYQILSKRKNFPITDGKKLLQNFGFEEVKNWPNQNLKIFKLNFPNSQFACR